MKDQSLEPRGKRRWIYGEVAYRTRAWGMVWGCILIVCCGMTVGSEPLLLVVGFGAISVAAFFRCIINWAIHFDAVARLEALDEEEERLKNERN